MTSLAPSESRTSHNPSRRNAIGCALLVGLCVLTTHPVLNMGISDDPSYARTALEFARTGHLVYNGWAAPTLGWQVLWGALFIKLFGFSFTVVRFSTLPIAMASVYLLHQIFVRSGLNLWNSLLGTLVVSLSPVFLALTPTFMTDIPAFFCLILCLYLCQRAVLAANTRAAIAWLCLAAISNLAGGTVRQTVWLGTLILVPSAAWLLRRRRGVLATSAFLWFLSILVIYLCIHWFYRQPYYPQDKIPFGHLGMAQIHGFELRWTEVLLSIVMFCLPVFIAFVPALLRLRRIFLLSALAFAVLWLGADVLLGPHFALFKAVLNPPWVNNTVTARGIEFSDDTLGSKPNILAFPIRAALGAIVVMAGFSFLAFVFSKPAMHRNEQLNEDSLSWNQLLWLVAPFTLAYLALLLPRGLFDNQSSVYDRYLLPVVASVVIVLTRFYQERVRARLPTITLVTLAIFSLWTVAAIHDLFAMDRARVAAADELTRAGVPRTQIQVSFEYDFWTEIDTAGYIANPRIQIPKGVGRPVSLRADYDPPYYFWYTYWVRQLHPKYFLVFSPQSYFAPTQFAPVSYRTWLPPFGATIYVQQLPDK